MLQLLSERLPGIDEPWRYDPHATLAGAEKDDGAEEDTVADEVASEARDAEQEATV